MILLVRIVKSPIKFLKLHPRIKLGPLALPIAVGRLEHLTLLILQSIVAACYILYSNSTDKFYIGATHTSAEDRLKKHNEAHYGTQHYTANTNDWVIFLIINNSSYEQALKVEKHIKKMKSRQYIKNLKAYPEMVQRLVNKYSD
jgi:putative endonuclease